MSKFLKIGDSGMPTEEAAISTSAGVGDANKIIETNAEGKIDESLIPGLDIKTYQASEAISAGDLVNLWDDTGTTKVRKADASSSDKRADGFATDAITSGATGPVTLYRGTNTQLTGMTAGKRMFLSDSVPGGVAATPPTTAGHIVQCIGFSASATVLEFLAGDPYVRG